MNTFEDVDISRVFESVFNDNIFSWSVFRRIIRVRLVVILGRTFILKNIFEKKLAIWQNLENTFKNLKNHL